MNPTPDQRRIIHELLTLASEGGPLPDPDSDLGKYLTSVVFQISPTNPLDEGLPEAPAQPVDAYGDCELLLDWCGWWLRRRAKIFEWYADAANYQAEFEGCDQPFGNEFFDDAPATAGRR